MESGGIEGGSALLDHAFAALSADLDQLVKIIDHGELDTVSGTAMVGYLQGFEQFRNRLPLIDHGLIAAIDKADLPAKLCQGNVTRVLTSALRISKAEAAGRVKAAEAVGPRFSMLGEELEPVRPHLALAQRSGEVSTQKVAMINKALEPVSKRGFDPDQIDAGEQILTEAAAQLTPEDLKTVIKGVVDRIDPDGTIPKDQLNEDRRFLHLRPTKDGAYAGEFRLTGAAGAKLKTLLDPLSKIRVDESGEIDTRTYGQRTHDALEEVCDRQLRAGDVTGVGAAPAIVIVTIDYNDLLSRTGSGTTTDGAILPVETLLELADEAEIIPTVLNSRGAVLHLGRTRRIASRSQTLALIARDGGCSLPGCAHPPQYCERHHILEWANGGLTDLNNLTLLCRYHHHNFLGRGWTVILNTDGLPEWRPPRWIDPHQKPRLNTRIIARLLSRRRDQSRAP